MTEHEARLHMMLEDESETWDLSPNDKAAIKWALDRISEFDSAKPLSDSARAADDVLSKPRGVV